MSAEIDGNGQYLRFPDPVCDALFIGDRDDDTLLLETLKDDDLTTLDACSVSNIVVARAKGRVLVRFSRTSELPAKHAWAQDVANRLKVVVVIQELTDWRYGEFLREFDSRYDLSKLIVAFNPIVGGIGITRFLPEPNKPDSVQQTASKPRWKSRDEIQAEREAAEEQKIVDLLAHYKATTFGKVSEVLGGLKPLWLGWLWFGSLAMLFSAAKIGKTRLYIALIKVLWEGTRWPDGSENPAPPRSKTLVLPYDRNHLEIAEGMRKLGIPDEAAICPHDPRDPTGISLLAMDDPLMKRVLAKIMEDNQDIRLIIIDTLTYASGKSLYKPEDVKVLLDDVMELAQRHGIALLVLCHENKEGKALGVRTGERARIHWHLVRVNEDDPKKLRLYVDRSNFSIPKALLVNHGENGVEFVADSGETPIGSTKREQCAHWLVNYLNTIHGVGTKVEYGTLIRAAGDAGFAGTYNEDSRRWSDVNLMNDAIRGINERKASWPDLHVYEIHKQEVPIYGRRPKVFYWLETEFSNDETPY